MANSASITSWTRVQPQTRDPELVRGLQARVRDPLWFLARQWQLARFRGEDAGQAMEAKLNARSRRLDRIQPRSGEVVHFDGSTPFEPMVEGETGPESLFEAVRWGLHLFEDLEEKGIKTPERISWLVREYPLLSAPTTSSMEYFELMKRRVPNGLAIARNKEILFSEAVLNQLGFTEEISINLWKSAVDALSRNINGYWVKSAGDIPQWNESRLEYNLKAQFAGTNTEPPISIHLDEYAGGTLDWHSFSRMADSEPAIEPTQELEQVINPSFVPTEISFRGAPVRRWWEFEDRDFDLTAMSVQKTDLAKVVFMQFAMLHSHDWFLVPLELTVGTMTWIDSIEVIDNFGVKTTLRQTQPLSDSTKSCVLFQLDAKRTGLFLTPGRGAVLESDPIEEVIFTRDEMANLVWAIENKLMQPLGEAVLSTAGASIPKQATIPEYQLATAAPAHWIPFIPADSKFRRAKLDKGNGPKGRILRPEVGLGEGYRPYFIFEEEVPRAGVKIGMNAHFTRWTNGKTFVWIGRQKTTGRGESDSGLRFDAI